MTVSAARAFTDSLTITAVPDVGTDIAFYATGALNTIYGLLQVNGTYTPGSAEVFTATLELVSE